MIYKHSIVFFINIDRCTSMFNYLFTPCYIVCGPWPCQLLLKSINQIKVQYPSTCNFTAAENKETAVDKAKDRILYNKVWKDNWTYWDTCQYWWKRQLNTCKSLKQDKTIHVRLIERLLILAIIYRLKIAIQ
jgi:hypothetical protein